MLSEIKVNNKTVKVDLSKPIDISIAIKSSKENLSAWYVQPPLFEPVKMGDWVGDVNQGGSVNFRDIFFNPHGHGTHTECVGHISKEKISINDCLKEFFFFAKLITVNPEKINGDEVITLDEVKKELNNCDATALVIRTSPNEASKLSRKYSNTNPPYIHHDAVKYITSLGINHLLIDLPSVDKEMDGGTLLSHHVFWEYPANTKLHRTITELIFISNEIPDGDYLLNLQIASFENDATPSKPILYKVN
jgi:kynurenine formamidase